MMLLIQGLIQGLFVGLTGYLAKFFTQKIAKAGAIFLILVSINVAFIAAINLALTGISMAAPEWLTIAWGWFMPANAEEVLAAYGAIYVARWVYDQNTNFQTTLFR